ncbi:Ig-like domain-containing protein [Pontibacter sp. G13]|uniref:Ig-like domain-containing protein n=1 Tax=Pontibacter sp. G13 TaxID=3074898 RepID=UPI00288B0EAE|nr:Ig-like domain-containing protein [Pontibacter sp. G13]WNJ16575.1 T9SS type A sorting domain-containing protein [Pontibacter sp. G13]
MRLLSWTLAATLWLTTWGTPALFAQTNIKYGPDYVVFEAEDTPSDMTHWAIREPGDPNYYVGTGNEIEAINQTYIEYTGPWAAAASPLSYTFVAPSTADYRLVMRLYQPLDSGEAGDKKNDVFIRLEGNYTSATTLTKADLETNRKFWGRGVRKWGTCHSLEKNGHHHATYGLIEGETYTLVMSGRSPKTSIDYILFYDEHLNLTVGNQDLAAKNPEKYRPYSSDVTVEMDTPKINLINLGDTLTVTATVKPDSAPDKSLTWSSADPNIASVDANGLITAVANGRTFVSATSNSSGASDQVEVIVGEIVPQTISWTASALTSELDISTDGTLLEAINFGSGTDASIYHTTVNSVPFVGMVNGTDDNVWANPSSQYFSTNSQNVVPPTVDNYDASVGLQAFDTLFSQFLWTSGQATEVTISNLNVGIKYQIQLLAADTRASQAGSYILLEETFGSPDTTSFTQSAGLSIIGEFVAETNFFSFLYSKIAGDSTVQGISLNAYQLRQLTPTSIAELPEEPLFILAPNPAEDWVSIRTTANSASVEVAIFALDGKKVYQDSFQQTSTQIDTRDFRPGVYVVQLSAQGQIHRQKLIIR